MKTLAPQPLLSATLALAMTDAHALAAAPVYTGIGESGVPAEFTGLIWGSVLALLAVLALGLWWLLRSPVERRKAQTAARRIPARASRRPRRLPAPGTLSPRAMPRRRTAVPV